MAEAKTPTYPAKTIAKLLLLTERRVQQLAKEGVIPKTSRGRYELAPAVQGYVRFLQERNIGATDNARQIVDYHQHKARKMAADAEIAEIEAARRRREVIDAVEVGRAWAHIVGTARTALLTSAPARIAAAVIGERDERAVRRAARDEIAAALAVLADTDPADTDITAPRHDERLQSDHA